MKTDNGDRLVTVKDIAECIAFDKSPHGVSRTIRQVRHWTQCDLLRPFSEKETGKGVPRLYLEEPTLEFSAFLLEFSRYGATVDILKFVADELYNHWRDEDGFYIHTAFGADINAYMQVAWDTDPATGRFVGAEVNFFDEQDRDLILLSEPSSSILINMAKIIKRIFEPDVA